VPFEQLGGQDAAALDLDHGGADAVQAGRAQPLIELDGFRAGWHMVAVVGVEGLADEFVNPGQGAERVGGEGFVAEQQQAVGLFAKDGLAQGVQRKADHPDVRSQAFDPRIDRAARLEIENLRGFQTVAPQQALDAVQHPGDIAHTANHLCLWKKRGQRGEFGRPHAIRVEHQLRRMRPVVISIEHRGQNFGALFVVNEQAVFAPLAHVALQRGEQSPHRSGHGGMEAGILAQQSRQQGRTRPRHAANEMDVVLHVRDIPSAPTQTVQGSWSNRVDSL